MIKYLTFLVGALISALLFTYIPTASTPDPVMQMVTLAWPGGDITYARAYDCGIKDGALYFTALDDPKGFAVIPLISISYAVCSPFDHTAPLTSIPSDPMRFN